MWNSVDPKEYQHMDDEEKQRQAANVVRLVTDPTFLVDAVRAAEVLLESYLPWFEQLGEHTNELQELLKEARKDGVTPSDEERQREIRALLLRIKNLAVFS
jgi:hypothetical protein